MASLFYSLFLKLFKNNLVLSDRDTLLKIKKRVCWFTRSNVNIYRKFLLKFENKRKGNETANFINLIHSH